MLTLLFALLALSYEKLAGPHRWRWCAIFAAVICLTLLAHIGVFVLTALTVALSFLGRLLLFVVRRHRPDARRQDERRAVAFFALAGLLAALVAFALFYRFPAHDLIAGQQALAVDQETTAPQPAPQNQRYRTGGATPDDRIGLPAVSTSHLSVALAREAWEQSFAFYRVWPVLACIAGAVLLWRKGMGASRRAAAFTIAVWLLVATIMLMVGIVARLYVRYPLFALPAVAVGSGVALAWLVRHARWGRYVAAALLAFSASPRC